MERRERKKDLSTNMNHEAAMDSFLGKLGLYRKPIAKDGSCLFRAVAEQIFNCQAEHTRVRKECIEYMKKNKDRFEAFVEGPFDHHLYNMRSQKEWAGQVEIQALSMMYKCDFLVYKDINSVPIKATENDYDKKIILCYSNGNHYDSIYPHSHKSNLGLCQSMVFELLYGQVFPLLMMKDPENKATSPTDSTDKQNDFGENVVVNGYGTGGSENGDENDGWTTVKSKKQGKMMTKNQKNVEQFYSEQAPLSPASSKLNWEVMRSIDPDSYRNIELEVWEECRKEQQQKDQAVAATFQFKKGDRCQVKHPFDEKLYLAFIDDVFDEKCKIWIPELKERKVVAFSRLKPKEQNPNSGYRELSGYYRKQENSQDNANTPRGGDDQKGGRRRKSNRNRKGNVGDGNEKSQQEMSMQDDASGRQRGDKNRRRRNNSNTAKPKEDKNEFNQREDGSSAQNQGSVEVSSFPALPKRDDQPATEKAKPDSDNNPDPATFWRKRREVEQMEKTTKEDNVLDSTPPTVKTPPSEENERNVKDDIVESQVEHVENEWSQSVPEQMPEEITPDIPTPEKTSPTFPKETHPELQQELPNEISQEEIPEEVQHEKPSGMAEERKVTPFVVEKRVNWLDLNNDIRTNYENMDTNNEKQSNEQTAKPTYMNNGPPLKETVIEIEDEETVNEEQSYNSMNPNLFDTPRNFEILKNPDRQEVQVEPSTTSSWYGEAETAVLGNGPTAEPVIKEGKESPVFQMANHTVQGNDAPPSPLVNQNESEQEREISPTATPDHSNRHPIDTATIQNEILNGNITYSSDPEGKDLHKDIEVVRYLYNYGIYMHHYVNSVFPGSAPISPMYPVMNPNAVYAMQQTYQNRAMMMPQNMYPQMQQSTHNENQQSPGEETRENNDSPGFKTSISMQQSPTYHTSHAMAQQAMFNMNYGQMFPAAGRPLYSNYSNMFPRTAFPRYSPNKVGYRPTGRKHNNRYIRNDNQPNMKFHNLQTGYGQYSKETEQ